MSEKRAYTPAEFAALFGREKTWTYRMLYAGKIKRLDGSYGKTMIPASEADRIEADIAVYQPAVRASAEARVRELPSKGSDRWSAWIAKSKTGRSTTKGAADAAALLRRGHKRR